MKSISRRSLIKNGALTGVGITLLGNPVWSSVLSGGSDNPVRIAIIGTGGRGTSLMGDLSLIYRYIAISVNFFTLGIIR